MASKKVAMGVFFMLCFMKAYSQQYGGGFKAVISGNNTIITVVTPAGWVCDYRFAEFSQNPCAFLQETAYSRDGIDVSQYIYIYFEEQNPYTPDEYVQNDISNYNKNGHNPVAKKMDFTLEHTENIKNYSLYEFTGMPKTYKELVLITQTDVSNIIVVYGYMTGSIQAGIEAGVFNQEKLESFEQIYQQSVPGFYELLKTLEIKVVKKIYPLGNGFLLFDEQRSEQTNEQIIE